MKRSRTRPTSQRHISLLSFHKDCFALILSYLSLAERVQFLTQICKTLSSAFFSNSQQATIFNSVTFTQRYKAGWQIFFERFAVAKCESLTIDHDARWSDSDEKEVFSRVSPTFFECSRTNPNYILHFAHKLKCLYWQEVELLMPILHLFQSLEDLSVQPLDTKTMLLVGKELDRASATGKNKLQILCAVDSPILFHLSTAFPCVTVLPVLYFYDDMPIAPPKLLSLHVTSVNFETDCVNAQTILERASLVPFLAKIEYLNLSIDANKVQPCPSHEAGRFSSPPTGRFCSRILTKYTLLNKTTQYTGVDAQEGLGD